MSIYVPYSILVINSLITSLYTANYSCRCIGVKSIEYYRSVHFPMITSLFIAIGIASYLLPKSENLLSLCFNIVVTISIVVFCNYTLGLNSSEKKIVIQIAKTMINKLKKN